MKDLKLEEINFSPLVNIAKEDNKYKDLTMFFDAASNPSIIFVFLGFCIATFYVGLIFLIPIIFILIISSKGIKKKNISSWRNFALLNGWDFTTASVNEIGLIPPSLHDVGREQVAYGIVRCVIEGYVCDFFSYEFKYKEANKYWVTRNYTIIKVDLNKSFPHVIVDSNKNFAAVNKNGATMKIMLEGNFNEYFSVFIEPNQQVDVLSVMTPDVMKTLVSNNSDQDLEIFDSSLYIISHKPRRSIEDIKQAVGSMLAIADEVKHKERSINYIPQLTQQDLNQAFMQRLIRRAKFRKVVSLISFLSIMIVCLLLLIFIILASFTHGN